MSDEMNTGEVMTLITTYAPDGAAISEAVMTNIITDLSERNLTYVTAKADVASAEDVLKDVKQCQQGIRTNRWTGNNVDDHLRAR